MTSEQLGILLQLPIESLKQIYHQSDIVTQLQASTELTDKMLSYIDSPSVKANQ